MASTDQVRIWYNSTVANHSDRGRPGYEPQSNWIFGHTFLRVAFPKAGSGHYSEPVHIDTVPAWNVYVALMRKHGVGMPSAGGVDRLRNIGTSDWPSLHAYLVACDLPPNSYKPQAFIADIEALRTNSGAQVFRNLRGDRMHDQINCSPQDIASGIVGWTEDGKEISVPNHTHEPEKDLTDKGEPFHDAWSWAEEYGLATQYTDPVDDVQKQEFMAFLQRYHDNMVEPALAKIWDAIRALGEPAASDVEERLHAVEQRLIKVRQAWEEPV